MRIPIWRAPSALAAVLQKRAGWGGPRLFHWGRVIPLMLGVGVLLAIGFVPLFDGPGYEISLSAGLVLPGLSAMVIAVETSRAQLTPSELFRRGMMSGAIFAGAGYATTLVHGARTGFCDFVGGTVHFGLTAGIGTCMGAVAGLAAGAIAARAAPTWRRTLAAILLAWLAPLIGILISLLRFYRSPIIFAYDPFFGFFSGALYDTVIDATQSLLSYRAGSLLTLGAAGALAMHLRWGDLRSGGHSVRLLRRDRPGVAILGVAGALASLALIQQGPALGHFQSAQSIARELGGALSGARCDVVYSTALRLDDARLFAKDCDEQVAANEHFFGVDGTGRYRAYLFHDSTEKRRLMGAADTYIAKPWRKEVYLQWSGYPHPVLGHELAHAVSGSFASGVFRIPGKWGGIIANPGLIEGVAVAASPDDQELTPEEWSKAMLDLGILPPLKRVLALGFLGENAAKSYTVAGAFIGHIRAMYGNDVLRQWYAGGDLADLTHRPFPDLEASWHAHLRELDIPPQAPVIARARFDRPSVFGRRCPHVVDALRREGDRSQGKGEYSDALDLYRRLLDFDSHDDATRFQMVTCLLREGNVHDGRGLLLAMSRDPALARPVRDRALSQLADLELAEDRPGNARDVYDALMSRALDEDALRTLEVKHRGALDPSHRGAIVALLVGTPERGIDMVIASALLGTWIGEDPSDGTPEYLLAKGFAARGLYQEASVRFDRALSKTLPAGRVTREALRQKIFTACALRDAGGARHAYEIWRDQGEPSDARKDAMRRLIDRCAPEPAPSP